MRATEEHNMSKTRAVMPSHVCRRIKQRANLHHLWWAFRSRVLSLIQFVPALHQFNNDGPAEVHQLETCHIGPAMHEPLQRYVLKTLRHGEKEGKMREEPVSTKLRSRLCAPLVTLYSIHNKVNLIIYTPI